MNTYEIVISQKTNKVLSIYIEGIIVHCKGVYFKLSIAGEEYPNRKTIKKLLEPLKDLRNGERFVVFILQILDVSDFTEASLRNTAPGFTITYK